MIDTGKFDVSTPNDREVLGVRTFDAPARLIFDAHTKPELIRRWLLGPPGWTMPICEVDLRVGGAYRYGWTQEGRKSFEMGGVFREIVAPKRLVATERFEENEMVWTMILEENGGRTTMTYSMLFHSKEARDAALATGMTGGMEQSYARLDGMVAEGSIR